MALPIDVRELLKSGDRFKKEREKTVRVELLVEVDVPDPLIDALHEALRAHTANARLDIRVPEPQTRLSVAPCDVAIVAVGDAGADMARELADAHAHGVRSVVIALGDEPRAETLAARLGQPLDDVLVRDTVDELLRTLAAWLVRELPAQRLALAHNFDFIRREAAAEAVRATALQNAIIGAVTIIPGADMPLMTANQAKMLLRIAAAYGQQLGAARIKELAVIVGGGFTFRAAAREALGVVPVLGWAVKGGVAYAGTIAMGKAAIAYFEQGADVAKVARRLRDEVADRLPARTPATPTSSGATVVLPAERPADVSR